MERNPGGMPYNSGLIIDDAGNVALYYRKLHPWVPVEPWEPGNLGIPVITSKGAEIMLRTAGHTPPVCAAWQFTNQSNVFCNLMVTASVCM
jgi:formamidase